MNFEEHKQIQQQEKDFKDLIKRLEYHSHHYFILRDYLSENKDFILKDGDYDYYIYVEKDDKYYKDLGKLFRKQAIVNMLNNLKELCDELNSYRQKLEEEEKDNYVDKNSK